MTDPVPTGPEPRSRPANLAISPAVIKAAAAEYKSARDELEYFGASEDFTRNPMEAALQAALESVLGDDEAMSAARRAYLNSPPHAEKHGADERLAHMRAALVAAFTEQDRKGSTVV